MEQPHMIKQTITFSDGTETVINYRGKIVDGILIPDSPEEKVEEAIVEPQVEEKTEETEETPK